MTGGAANPAHFPAVELLNTGTELLLGAVLNTHTQFVGRGLFTLGLRLTRQTSVPDGDVIGGVLKETFDRAWAVILTGGLGPTSDDVTRDEVARLLGREMAFDDRVMASIAARFARRNLSMPERVRRQAMVPQGAEVLTNPNGTAPGLYFAPAARENAQGLSPHVFCLPGPPRELHPMFETQVLPRLKNALPPGVNVPHMQIVKIVGLGESEVEARVGAEIEAMEGVELGYCARSGEVDVRLIGMPEAVRAAVKLVRDHTEEHVVSVDGRDLPEVVVDALRTRGRTLAVAESCTGGFLTHRLTNVPGASEVFLEGFVTYANTAKEMRLGIDSRLLASHGAVSEVVAREMAVNARARTGADYALATTGIAGPGGGTPEKPVGTVFIALARPHAEPVVLRRLYATEREVFKHLTVQTALDLLRRDLRTPDL